MSQGSEREQSILDVVERAQRRTARSVARLERLQEEIAAALPPVQTPGIHAEMDDAGRLTELSIDPQVVAGLDGETIERGLTLAIGQAAARRPVPGVDALRGRFGDLDLAAVLDQVFARPTEAAPHPVWDDARQVGVVMDGGQVRGVVLDRAWAAAAFTTDLAARVRAAVDAAVEREAV